MGDIGKTDSNGNLFVTGRVKESGSDTVLSRFRIDIFDKISSWEIFDIISIWGFDHFFSISFEINLNRLKDIIVLKNAKKINASQIEDLLMQCLETTGEICVKAKPNENNYDDIYAFIYAR